MQRLAGAKAELKRRQTEERIRYFEAMHPGMTNVNYPNIPVNDQKGMLLSPADIRFGLGANRACKTETGAVDTIWFSLGTHPVRSKYRMPPVHGRVTAPKYEDGCKGVVLKKYRSMIPHYELAGSSWVKAWSEKSKMLTFANGSTINFKSSEMDLNTFGGVDLDWCWDDEHIPEKYFIENIARLVDRRGYYIKTMTPEAGQTWEKDFIDDPPPNVSVAHWYFDIEGNIYLSKDGVEQIKSTIRDPRLAEAKLHGRFVALTGMVFPQYSKVHLVTPDFEIPSHWPKTFLVDPHLRKPAALLWMAWDTHEDIVYIYRTAKKQMPVPQLKQYIQAQSAGEKIGLWLGDKSQGGEGENIHGKKSILEQFNDLDMPIQPIGFGGDMAYEAAVEDMRQRLTRDPISHALGVRVFQSCDTDIEYIDGRRCGSLFWELERYHFKKEQKSDEETFREKVATVDDDLITCALYGLMAGPSGSTESVTVLASANDTGERDEFTGW